jgi:tRNA uridine 5-carboxymethylaminomethyl modification enzyme
MKNEKYYDYELIVVGSGIAGSEAGIISAKTGIKTLIINISMDTTAALKYSSKIGGIIKGKLLDENAANGGFIKKAIYKNRIAQKKEKEGKNFQWSYIVDKRKFGLFYKYCLENQDNLDTRQGLVTDLVILNENYNKKYKIKLSDGSIYSSTSLIIAAGTFLNASTIWGKNKISAGRQGEINSKELYKSLVKIGYKFKKHKVFVGAGIDRKLIDLKKIRKIKSVQEPDQELFSETGCEIKYEQEIIWQKYFSFKTAIRKSEISFFIKDLRKKYKKEEFDKLTDITLNNLKSEVSIGEDLELELLPEGDRTTELYIDNFNFAFSETEQSIILNNLWGMEKAEIIRPGYCIEYECLKEGQLNLNMESKMHKNIFFAGEVNGPAGYEKVALQGLNTGISANKNINKF